MASQANINYCQLFGFGRIHGRLLLLFEYFSVNTLCF